MGAGGERDPGSGLERMASREARLTECDPALPGCAKLHTVGLFLLSAPRRTALTVTIRSPPVRAGQQRGTRWKRCYTAGGIASRDDVLTRWAIKPIRTAGCADKTLITVGSRHRPFCQQAQGVAPLRHLVTQDRGRFLRQYPGWRDRHACTRATFTGPRK